MKVGDRIEGTATDGYTHSLVPLKDGQKEFKMPKQLGRYVGMNFNGIRPMPVKYEYLHSKFKGWWDLWAGKVRNIPEELLPSRKPKAMHYRLILEYYAARWVMENLRSAILTGVCDRPREINTLWPEWFGKNEDKLLRIFSKTGGLDADAYNDAEIQLLNIHILKNLEFLRVRQGLNWHDVLERLSYRKGKFFNRREQTFLNYARFKTPIPLNMLLQAAALFNVSLDTLVTKTLYAERQEPPLQSSD